jgi:hypothetical protein
MVVPRDLLHEFGHEANIGFSLQGDDKGPSGAANRDPRRSPEEISSTPFIVSSSGGATVCA